MAICRAAVRRTGARSGTGSGAARQGVLHARGASGERMSELRPDRCPQCGGPNECGMAAGKSECWCFQVKIAEEALERVPEEERGRLCVCQACGMRMRAGKGIERDTPEAPKRSPSKYE
jgi:hypothetical protein